MGAHKDGERSLGKNVGHSSAQPTRRGVLKGAATGVAALGVGGTRSIFAQSGDTARKEQFLLDRLTFGRTPEMVQELRTRGWTGFLEWQLDADNIDDSAADAAVAAENPDASTLWGYSPYDIAHDPQYVPFPGAVVQGQAPQAVILYGHHSRRQLKWVMTDFLQNVHNTFLPQPNGYFFWGSFLRDVIHANALGSYPALVDASGGHGSMSLYLAQYLSSAANPIENYARELMELHTVGKEAHLGFPTFTEPDIAEAAKILTGWSFVQFPSNLQFGEFDFDGMAHAGGDKSIAFLGQTYPDPLRSGAGEGEGHDFIADLTHYPLTALHIAWRLVQWFLGDDVAGRYQQPWLRTANAYHVSGGDLKATLRELFAEAHYDQLAIAANEKVRRPLPLLVAAMRTSGAAIDLQSPAVWSWLSQLYKMGQVPGWWPAPDGYPAANEAWTGSMQARIEFLHDTFLGDNGLAVPTSVLASIFPANVPTTSYARRANAHVFGNCLPEAEVDAIQLYLTPASGPPPAGDLRLWALFLTMSAPSYQYLCS